MKLIFASNNSHKLQELRAAIGSNLEIISLNDAGIFQDLPEPFPTLKENARSKAQFVNRLTGGENCFSEDTGLEVDALGGEPGVHSARYAGDRTRETISGSCSGPWQIHPTAAPGLQLLFV